MNWFAPNIDSLVREIQAFKINQQVQSAQIIALLQEQNQLLKQILSKN